MVRRGTGALLLLVGVLAGCKNKSLASGPAYVGAGATTPTRGGTLHFSINDGVKSLDPQVAYDEYSIYPLHYTMDTLVGYEKTMSPNAVGLIPQLATNMPAAEERTMKHPVSGEDIKVWVYVFHLRDGITFYDPTPPPGMAKVRPIEPRHFKYAIERCLDPDTSSPAQSFFEAIGGAPEMIAREGDKGPREAWGLVAEGRDLTIILTKPDPTLMYKLAMKFASPIEPEVVKHYGADGLNAHEVSSGPFYVTNYDRDIRIQFKKNPEYWDKNSIYLDGIDMQLMVERQVGFMKFRARETDVVDRMTVQDLLSIGEEPAWQPYLLRDKSIDIYGERFDMTMKPFDDKRVRQAFNYAINRDHLAQLGYGTMLPAKGPLPPGMPGYNPELRGYPYDPAKAKALLTEAGYPDGFELDYFITGPDEKVEKIALSVQADMARVGVRLKIKRLTFPVHLAARMSAGKIPFGLDSWVQDFPDPSNFLEFLFHSKYRAPTNAVNSSQYSNPEVDKLLDAAAIELDPAKRTELYHQAEQMIVDDAPWVFEYHSVRVEARQPWLMDYKMHPVWIRDFRYVWLDLPTRPR